MYRPISDYALIGDMQSAALISSAGSIDFLCLPRFDSPALFLRLVDDERGGFCSITPAGLRSHARHYLEHTNILETAFACDGGSLVLTDFMPVLRLDENKGKGQDVEAAHRLIRLFHCSEGEVDCDIVVNPTFDFARANAHLVARGEDQVMYTGPHGALHVQMPAAFTLSDGSLRCRFRLRQGETCALVLTWAELLHDVTPLTSDDLRRSLEATRDYWQHWSEACNLQGGHYAIALRSALVLKLLIFEPTGAIIAAPTTSLPEHIGGPRNWDYRFTWLRDASLTMVALMNLGYFGEAHDFLHFLRRALPSAAAHFQIMYRADGGREVPEITLDHLDGYRGSRPVRIGNGAAGQLQLGIYGELLHSVFLYWQHEAFDRRNDSFRRDFWPLVQGIAEFVSTHWRDCDAGIWESRGGPQRHTHSIGMCWAALDRAIRLTRQYLSGEDVSRWEREREEIIRDLQENGFDRQLGAYTQSYGSSAMDASILRLPLQHVLDAKSERMRSTIRVLEQRLMQNGLVYRYRQSESDDGLQGSEGTFTACAFWLVENYAMQGRLREAEELFQHVLSYANDLGLMSEEIDPQNGEQLGNFPQAFTHIALINAAVRLASAQRGDVPKTQKLMQSHETKAG